MGSGVLHYVVLFVVSDVFAQAQEGRAHSQTP